MKAGVINLLIICVMVTTVQFLACNREKASLPVLVTISPANVTAYTISTGGNIISNGGSKAASAGVCWSTSENPTINDNKTSTEATIGKFYCLVSGLIPLTNYYLRSYITNEAGTAYGNQINFSTSMENSVVTDIDGNDYGTVTLGSQIWMTCNLQTTRYSNGDLIGTTEPASLVLPSSTSPSPGYQWSYDSREDLTSRYGRLYTWYAATDTRNICPAGWHLPSDVEWTVLTGYLADHGYGYIGDGYQLAMSMAAVNDWQNSSVRGSAGFNGTDNNRSGFNGLPAGCFTNEKRFDALGQGAFWWTSTPVNDKYGWMREIYFNDSRVARIDYWDKFRAFSVRCLKNN